MRAQVTGSYHAQYINPTFRVALMILDMFYKINKFVMKFGENVRYFQMIKCPVIFYYSLIF